MTQSRSDALAAAEVLIIYESFFLLLLFLAKILILNIIICLSFFFLSFEKCVVGKVEWEEYILFYFRSIDTE